MLPALPESRPDEVNQAVRALALAPVVAAEMVRTCAALGLDGSWPRSPGSIGSAGLGYLAFRVAPFGAAPPPVIAAALGVFPEPLIAEAVLTAGRTTSLADVWSARLEVAGAVLGRALGSATRDVERTADFLRALTEDLSISGRPAFAAIARQERPRSRWAQIWLSAEALVEHRNNARFNAASSELTGPEYVALHAARRGAPPAAVLAELGWPNDAARATLAQLEGRHLLNEGILTSDAVSLFHELDFTSGRAQREIAVRLGDDADEHLARVERWSDMLRATRDLAEHLRNAAVFALTCA